MTREKVLIGLGILVIISPWSGLPVAWLMWALLFIGIAVIGIGASLHVRTRTEETNLVYTKTNGES